MFVVATELVASHLKVRAGQGQGEVKRGVERGVDVRRGVGMDSTELLSTREPRY